MPRWRLGFGKAAASKPTRETLLNDGLELAMDWGEDWLAPIQDRLLQRHRSLQRAELDELDAACREAMKFGHETAYAMVHEHGKNVSQEAFVPLVRARYPWVSAENGARLFNQSMYYAWKTGGPARGP
jgi:hypothetical protein